MSAYETLLVDRSPGGREDDAVMLVTLNRPHVRNAFDTTMARELVALFESLALDADGVRCIVVTGARGADGTYAFCAGGDLKERQGMSDAQWARQHLVFERMTRALLDCPVPMIGAVAGPAFAGGCEIACTMDFLYAGHSARFAQTETRIGIIPGAGGTQTLARAIGERRAKEVILSARPFSAEQALEWGLVNALFADDALLAAALDTAAAIAANAPIAVAQAKRAIHRGLQMSLRDGLAFEIEAYNRTVTTRDRREGVDAFNARRAPTFEGR